MACNTCPEGPVTSVVPFTVISEPHSQVATPGAPIPIKIGEPLSSACERATVVGSIPVVIRHPAFTLINGGVALNLVSNAGIRNLSSFFANPQGCYADRDARLASTCC